MKRPVFKSGFKDELNNYIDYKVASGYKEVTYYVFFKKFDNFCFERNIKGVTFSREDADAWLEKIEAEATTTHYARVNQIKGFLEYLSLKGYDLYLIDDVYFRTTGFQPHIYTDDEIKRYFTAVDSYSPSRDKMDVIIVPVVFRLLYCCGTRATETLFIRKRNVDLENGIIKLTQTKNDMERYIVLSSELKDLMKQFADKCFYLLGDNDFIFTTLARKRSSVTRLYDLHRLFLKQAGIPFLGNGNGPRVHDWRHTFAVRSFKQMIDQGLDMYVALPILSYPVIWVIKPYMPLNDTFV